MVTDFPWGGKCTGDYLSQGCKSCQQGRSTVIFVTGLCNATCYYCPVGLNRMFKDVAYANERPIESINDLLDEVLKCQSHAASLTGGDPLLSPSRCYEYAKTLKEKYGSDFYIHLYTPGREGSPEMFHLLSEVVDEIRFHPKTPADVENISLAMNYRWNVGIEIPATPGLHETQFFQDYVKLYAKLCRDYGKENGFININELEISERNFIKLVKRKLVTEQDENNLGISVEGSNSEAIQILEFISNEYPIISTHYCPAGQKDGIQLPNRLLHRAHTVMLASDYVIEDWTESGSSRGLLIRGVIRLSQSKKSNTVNMEYLKKIKKKLTESFNIPKDQISLDLERRQILTRADFLEENSKEIKEAFPELIIGMVEEYPTDERLETSFYSF
jgi:pyruvate formate-lyase activating enzyme-like uncharacterized protein